MAALDAATPDGYDYYDVNSILADETMVPATFLHGCSGIGQILDPSSDSPTLSPGSKADVPLWMIPVMARRHLLDISLPIFYRDKMRRKIKAGAGCEDLRARCSFFYTVASRVHAAMQTTGTADESFPGFVSSTFAGRYKDLLTKAPLIESNAECSLIQGKLTNEELSLFNIAADAAAAHDKYRANRDSSASGAAMAAAAHARARKRKWQQGGQENRKPWSRILIEDLLNKRLGMVLLKKIIIIIFNIYESNFLACKISLSQ